VGRTFPVVSHRRSSNPLFAVVAALLATAAARAEPTAASVSSAAPSVAPGSGISSPAPEPPDEPFGDADRFRASLSVMALASAGLLPNVGFGGGARLGFRWRWVSAAIEGRGLRTPDFSLSPGQSAHALAGLGILSVCGIFPEPSLPLGLYSLDACFVTGVGRLAVMPNTADSLEAHPYMMLLGLRWVATWQLSPGLYFRSFLELDLNPLNVNLSFNGRTVWGGWEGEASIPPHFGGFLGFEFDIVSGQPESWQKPAKNPQDPRR
jgi:hypothetical protein